ncbi:MAG: hypothetical protein ACIAQF_10785 [Phycisphaerales bacterium JB065]
MKNCSRKRMAMSGVLAATMVGGAGMLIAPSTLANTAITQDAEAPVKLPAAKEIIAKYVQVTGGEDAYKARKSIVTKAKLEIPMAGMTADLTMRQLAPNKMITVVDLGNFGKQTTIFDGETGWEISSMTGPRLLSEEETGSAKRQAAFDAQIDPDKYYETMETTAKKDFGGESAYEVKLTAKDGSSVTQYYAVESGLMLGQTSTQVTQMGEVESTVKLGDYREVGGMKVPFKITIEMPAMGMTQELKITSVEFDAVVDAKEFAMPAEIKQLKEQRDGAAN